ncbi:Rhomboid family protein [Salinarchaeum sp. Harcht-Bsk1]|uniref:hypothetical protein n=1 Tax=Salinarchaeum sp. Harcht-Bsk1 TaxID=1333523 RepID=UPI0003424706|nr:hypothetical protein [Salinarchaeum sp. Harcht-Bsk1]AGN02907.1 Rhomboid family protein [Salinarchaeum sp. Harcht-Bsk1]
MLPSPYAVLIVATYAVALAIAWYLGDGDRWRKRLTDRFWYGVPWGTLVSIAFVLAVYLFVQGGIEHWHDPTVIPFRAWSYLYPVGLLTAGFAHSSSGHLVGNLMGTIALAPIAEYAWGHYPGGSRSTTSDRSTDQATDRLDGTPRLRERLQTWTTIPWVRAFVCFPGAVLALGLLTALFAVGPVIGFSGVVFAFAAFALVRYPIATLVAILLSGVLSTTYYAIQYPVVYAEISGSAPSVPWWATIAVQGHALGILLGVVLGLALMHHRSVAPNVNRVFLAMLVYGMSEGLWAVYWFEGNGVYVLYRGLGVSLVVGLAVLVALAVTSSDRPVTATLARLPRSPTPSQVAIGFLALLALAVTATGGYSIVAGKSFVVLVVVGLFALVLAVPAVAVLAPVTFDAAPTGFQSTFTVLVVVLVLVAIPATIPNLVTVGDDPVPSDQSIEVDGYSITYAEDVRNQMIPAIELPAVANETAVPTSGVIVVNEERHIWTTALSKQYLASEGDGSVTVGGVGWRETVHADRIGWTVTGNDTAYAIDLSHGNESIRAYSSPEQRAQPVIENHTVGLVPARDRFELRVYQNNSTVGRSPIPAIGNDTQVGPITFSTGQSNDLVTIFAIADGTRVQIAQRETYRQI